MIRTIATVLAMFWTTPVVTEKVGVGDRGAVDLAPFACTDTPRSTVIQRVCYDRDSRYLLIGIRGSYRDYCAVPPAIFDGFVTAPSMGQFYRKNIEVPWRRRAPFNCDGQRATRL